MSIVTARGLGFHVQELGAGPPLVMLHGLLGTLASWYLTAAPVLARHRRVRLYDLRGHGRSARARTGYDVRTMAADLDALVADLAEPLDLVGHSWGGLAALRFALDHPARVRRLALVEAPLPSSQMVELSALSAGEAELRDGILSVMPVSLREEMINGNRRATRMLASFMFLLRETSMLADVHAEPDLTDAELSRLACPTLLLYGDRSGCAPAGARLARVVPGARLVMFPGGHYLHYEAKEQVADTLVELFGERGALRRTGG